MSRLMWCSSLVVLLALSYPARADSLRLALELEGTLLERENGFTLTVEGEGGWSLELPEPLRVVARTSLRQHPNGKVCVRGTVSARTVGDNLQLRDRTVEVGDLFPLLPGVAVQSIIPQTPAASSLHEGDIIREIDGKEVGSYEDLLRSLDKLRGKEVKIVVEREGKAILLDELTLQSNGPALGIYGRTIWTREGRGGVPTSLDEKVSPTEKAPRKE